MFFTKLSLFMKSILEQSVNSKIMQGSLVWQTILAMVGRFFGTYAMNTGFQFTVEVGSS